MNIADWKHSSLLFLTEKEQQYTYGELHSGVCYFYHQYQSIDSTIKTLILEADNSFISYCRFLGAMLCQHTVMLCSPAQFKLPDYLATLQKELTDPSQCLPLNKDEKIIANNIVDVKINSMNFLVRTSGSSGEKFKLVLHDAHLFFKKYKLIGIHFKKTMAFSPAESIAGIETLLEVLTHKLELITPVDQLSPELIADLIRDHKIDYFQTTPTFMNLMIISQVVSTKQLGSLRKIAYGSEPSQSTVVQTYKKNLNPIELMHTYGMSEIGIQKTITDQNDPTQFILDEKFNSYKITDGILEIKSLTKMQNYLNAEELPSQYGADWFYTQDEVIQTGQWLKVLGRAGDMINIAGRKFFPSELEESLGKMPGVLDVTVSFEKNDLIGAILTATIAISDDRDETHFRKDLKLFLQENIISYMHPHKIKITRQIDLPPRLKKMRKV